ncbi:MAG TPA: FAD-binding protein [Aldersonia sp.]
MADPIDELGRRLRGRLVRRGDPAYDDARRVYNGSIDKRPLALAYCCDTEDVVSSIRWAREHDVVIAVRGGGHNGPGLGCVDDGVVVDLSEIRNVTVDPETRTVRVGGGCVSRDVDEATHPHGLAVPFGILSSTGVGGLTLGGGTGYLTRAYGLTVDNLLGAEVVLADGRVVTADPMNHRDLFWALRGGGGNFGVVVSFVFRAHPVAQIYGGPVFYDLADARALIAAYRDFLPTAPEKLGIFFGFKTVPAVDPFPREHWSKPVCAFITCYTGPEAEGIATMAPLLDAVPAPLFDWRTTMPFPNLQAMFDPLLPPGLHWYWKGDFVRSLPDAAIDVHLEHAARLAPGTKSMMHLYPIDGAVHRVGPSDTAWRTRNAAWSMVIVGVEEDPADAGRSSQWARDYWAAVHPFSADGGYVNFWMDDTPIERLRATYGDNYDRLARIKAIYDPDNVFHINQNIAPATSAVAPTA